MILFYAIATVATIIGIGLVLKGATVDNESPDNGTIPDSTGDSGDANGGNSPSPSASDTGDVVGVATDKLKDLERFSSSKYEDPPGSGKWSIGYGHQIQRGENFPQYISEDTAIGLLATDVSLAWGCVRQKVHVAINTNQGAALTSLCFNVGCSAFGSSTLLRKLNIGDYTGAAAEFDRWIYSGGVISNGLVSRRQQERNLFEA